MTNEQIKQQIMTLWWPRYSKRIKKMGPEETQSQADALVNMTRREMDDLKLIGLDEETAWTEARRICLVPPVVPDQK